MDALEAARRRWVAQENDWWRESQLDHALALCESPIEQLLALAIIDSNFSRHHGVRIARPKPDAGHVLPYNPLPEENQELTLYPQWRLKRWRIDFRLDWERFETAQSAKTVLIECDGHDFHERTKKQAASDRSRDRALQRAGYQIIRFTGSELTRNSKRCAAETLAALYA